MNTDSISEIVSTEQDSYVMPASIAQQRIWSSCGKHGAAWNVAVRFVLRGTLSLPEFQSALQSLIADNEILRTSFVFEGSELQQAIHPELHVPVSVFDLRELEEGERDRELDRISKQEAGWVFDLKVLPLIRIVLVQVREDEHVLLLTLHHSICDGWSIGLISSELMKAYGRGVEGKVGDRSEQLQYADYAVWHAERRQSVEYQGHEEFWRQYLVPGWGRPRTRLLATRGDSDGPASQIVSSMLPLSLTDALRTLARQKGTTFFHVVLSAFGILQASEQGGDTFSAGVPVSGRSSTELETVIGPFVNYLPMRMRLSPTSTVVETLQAVAAEFTELLSHSEYRIEDMLSTNEGGADLFDTAFICQRDFVRPVSAGGLELTAIPSISPGALLAKTFFLVEREEGWRASCEVDTSRYSIDEAKRLLSSFEQVLQCFALRSDQTVGEILALIATDVTRALVPPAATDSDSSTNPGETKASDAELSFLEFPASEAQARYWLLDQSQAGNSTFHLRIRLAIEGTLDVACLVRAFEYLVGRHESLRTTFAMKDEGLRQRVHDQSLPFSFEQVENLLAEDVDRGEETETILASEDKWEFDLEEGPLLRVLLIHLAEDKWILAVTMAHLIGDGWSCGVLQRELQESYRALVAAETPNLQEVGIQYADYAVHEQSWLRSEEAKNRLAFWRKQLRGKLAALDLPVDITITQTAKDKGAVVSAALDPSTAAAVRMLARKLDTTPFVIYGAIFQALLFRYSGQTDIVFSTPLASRTEETESAIGPFSVPVLLRSKVESDWSSRQYIDAFRDLALDTFDNALPFERYAELVALSTCRGRHALNQLCFFYQKAFVDTSSVAGLRIEPMPTTVTGAGFEWQLAVIERSDAMIAELQYDAGVYSRDSIQIVLRHYEHLIEQCIGALDAPVRSLTFATTEEIEAAEHNGQMLPVSRRALGIDLAPIPKEDRTDEGQRDVAARTGEEIRMAQIWEKVFRRSGLGIHANFFDLGGHSLTLARLQAIIQKEYGVRIKAADIFVAPTIASLAARLDGTGQSVALHPRLIPLRLEGSQAPLFLISQSMVFRRMAELLGPDQPVFTIQMEDEDLNRLGTNVAFEQIASFYVDIIREVRPHGPYRIGGWCMSGWIAYEVAQQLRALGETVEMLLVVDAWAPGYWRDMVGGKRLFAKGSYYWSRLRLHARSLSPMTHGQRLKFLGERFRLWRATTARLLASGLSAAGVSLDVRMEEQTTFVDQVVFAASRKYRAQQWVGKALFFRSSEQPVGKFLAEDMGWSELISTDVTIATLPGDHRRIFDDPGAGILAEGILKLLAPGTPLRRDVLSRAQQLRSRTGYSDSASCAIVTR